MLTQETLGTIIGTAFAHHFDEHFYRRETKLFDSFFLNGSSFHLSFHPLYYIYKTIIKENIKAVFFDIDGTYFDQVQQCVLKENIEAVNALQKAGYKVTIASARPFLTAKELPILEGVTWDAIVTSGGQEIYDVQYQLMHLNNFLKNDLKEIFHIASIHHFPIYAVGEHSFFTEHSKFTLLTTISHCNT